MMRKKISAFITLITIVLTCFVPSIKVAAEINIPKLDGYIYIQDFADVLSDKEEQEIIQIGSELEKNTSIQLMLATVDDLQGQDIESYANAMFREYGLGQEDKDNGVLFLYSTDENSSSNYRIEVGYGVEGVLTDIRSGQILDEYAVPYRDEGKPEDGLVPTYKAIASFLNKADLDSSEPTDYTDEETSGLSLIFKIIIGIIVVVLIILDFIFFDGMITFTILRILAAAARSGGGGHGGGGGSRGGGGGSSGGGGASR